MQLFLSKRSHIVLKGISWMGILRLLTRAATFLEIIIVARILNPSQYGEYSVAMLLMAFFETITEFGATVFLIQEIDSIQKYLNEIWCIAIIRGIVMSVGLYFFAHLLATFLHISDLERVIQFVALIPLIRGFINPAIIIYQKHLEFRTEFFLRVGISCIEFFCTVILLLLFKDPVAIVFGDIIAASVELLLSYVLIKQKPVLSFVYTKFLYIIHHIKWITTYSIFQYIASETDSFATSKYLGVGATGFYQMAMKFSVEPMFEFADVVSQVTFPIYSQEQKKKEKLLSTFYKVVILLVVFLLPFTLLLLFFAKPIILYTVGYKWISVTSFLSVLLVYGFIRSLFGYSATLFLALHKQHYVAMMIAVRCVVLIATIIPMIIHFGLIGACYSLLFSAIVEIPISIFFLLRLSNI